MKDYTKSVSFSVGLLMLIAVFIGIVTSMTVWLGDDIAYSYDFRPDHHGEYVRSVSQAFQSQVQHYIISNGRFLAHLLVQCFIGFLGKTSFAVCNGLAYIIFIYLLSRLCRIRLSDFKAFASMTIFALIIFQTKMTPTCQIGYIWMFILSVGFLICFLSERSYDKWWQIVLLTLMSFIAGNGNEGLNVGISGGLIIYWLYNRKRLNLTRHLMIVGFGIGTLVVCLSPGTLARGGTSAWGSFGSIATNIQYFFMIVKSSFVMIAVVIWQKFHNKKSIKEIYRSNQLFIWIWGISMLFNIVIGIYTNRQLFGAELMALIITIRILPHHSFNSLWLCISTAILILLYLLQIEYVVRVNNFCQELTESFRKSHNGLIYMDINLTNYLPYPTWFSPSLHVYAATESDRGACKVFTDELNRQFGSNKKLTVLPESFLGKDSLHLTDSIYSTPQPGVFLVVKSKNSPKQPRKVLVLDAPFVHKVIDDKPLIIDKENLTYENDNWECIYVTEEFPECFGVYSYSYYFETQDNKE